MNLDAELVFMPYNSGGINKHFRGTYSLCLLPWRW